MKIIVEVIKDYDRVIKYKIKNGEVVGIDFFQGTDDDTVDNLMKQELVANPILDIYNNLIGQEKYMTNGVALLKRKYKINYAIELYCMAYIYQEI